MKFASRVALRYIFSRKNFSFITVIALISLIGISVGIAALIAVLSIFNGFREFTEEQLLGYDPHIKIEAKKGAWLNKDDSIFNFVNKLEEVDKATPVIEGRTIGIAGSNMQVFTFKASDSGKFLNQKNLENSVVMGSFYIEKIKGLPCVVLGAGISDRLKAASGDTISLTSPKNIEKSIKAFAPKAPIQALVAGVVQTNNRELDNSIVFGSKKIAQSLFSPPENSITALDIKLKSINKVDEVKAALYQKIPESAVATTWRDLHKELFKIMNFERTLTFIVLALIIVIAAFNALASLSMTVVEKRSDIGVLRSLGASQKDISRIFRLQGLIIGVFSSILGSILGLGFCWGQSKFGWFKMDSANFLIENIPVSVNYIDVMLVVAVALILSYLASIYPAKRASETLISEAIRSE